MGIEWRPNAAKWQQIAEAIIERIKSGQYAPDTALPSQHQLVAEYGVAAGTAQKTLRRLIEQGWAYAVVGVGTFVAPPESWPGE